jgi:hypothetical protein
LLAKLPQEYRGGVWFYAQIRLQREAQAWEKRSPTQESLAQALVLTLLEADKT